MDRVGTRAVVTDGETREAMLEIKIPENALCNGQDGSQGKENVDCSTEFASRERDVRPQTWLRTYNLR